MHRAHLQELRSLARDMRIQGLMPAPPVLAPPVPERPKPHRIWVADWTVILVNNNEEFEVPNVYLENPDQYDLYGKLFPGMSYNFMSQRAPSNLEPGKRPIQYLVARFERHQVRGMISGNWRWEGLGEW